MSLSDEINLVLNYLESIGQDIQRDQAEDSRQNDTLQSDCQVDIGILNGDIEEANLKSIEATSDIQVNNPILEQKADLLEEKKANLANNEQALEYLEKSYQKKFKEYLAEKEEHTQAESVIIQAKQNLKTVFGGYPSFLEEKKETKESFLEVSQHFFYHSKNTYKRKSWSSFFRILSQISSSQAIQADQDSVNRLFNVIDDLLDKITASLNIETQAFTQYEQDYENKTVEMNNDIEELKDSIEQLETEIESLTSQLEYDTHLKEVNEQRSTDKQAELQSRQSFCVEQQNQYDSRTTGRNEQTETINQILDIVNSQSGVFKRYVSERSEDDISHT